MIVATRAHSWRRPTSVFDKRNRNTNTSARARTKASVYQNGGQGGCDHSKKDCWDCGTKLFGFLLLAVMADFPMVSLSLSSYTARPKSKSRPRSRMGNRAATSQGKLNLVESEVLSHLFSFLDAAALSRAECVCCAWLRTARGDGGCLWRWLYIVEPSRSYPL
jgi:hypothetical protein